MITVSLITSLPFQPLLSTSLLDEFIKSSTPATSIANEIAEPETYIYALSLQLLSFLFVVCDHLVVVCDWSIDIHLIKLIATAQMLNGQMSTQANLIWFLKSKVKNDELTALEDTLDAILGKDSARIVNGDESELMCAVMKTPSKVDGDLQIVKNGPTTSEKSWLQAATRYWETSIKKSTLFSDYARFMP